MSDGSERATNKEMSMIISKIKKYMENPTPLRPCLTVRNVLAVLNEALPLLREDPDGVTCGTETTVHVVGPLHGNFTALMDVFNIGGPLPWFTYVFLGDIIADGPNSIEVLCYILAYKVIHPHRVFILLGKSELNFLLSLKAMRERDQTKPVPTAVPQVSPSIALGRVRHVLEAKENRNQDFLTEIYQKYGDLVDDQMNNLVNMFEVVFATMPIYAIVGVYFCATGLPAEEDASDNPIVDDLGMLSRGLRAYRQEVKVSAVRGFLYKNDFSGMIISHITLDVEESSEECVRRIVYCAWPENGRADRIPVFHMDMKQNISVTYYQRIPPKDLMKETREDLLGIPEGLIF